MLESLVALVIYLIVVGLILWLLTLVINALPLQAPIKEVLNTVVLVIGVIIVIYVLLGFLGGVPALPRLHTLR